MPRDSFLADLEGAAIAGEEFIDAGDSVVVQVHQSATGPGSGAHVAMLYQDRPVWLMTAVREVSPAEGSN